MRASGWRDMIRAAVTEHGDLEILIGQEDGKVQITEPKISKVKGAGESAFLIVSGHEFPGEKKQRPSRMQITCHPLDGDVEIDWLTGAAVSKGAWHEGSHMVLLAERFDVDVLIAELMRMDTKKIVVDV